MKTSSLAPALLAATLFLVPVLPAQDTPAADMNESAESSEKMASRHAEILKRFDKNADGKLDDAEKAAAKEFNRENGDERRNKARKELGKRAISRFDKDGDGKLSDAEKSAALEAMAKEHQKRAEKSK